MFTLAGSLLFGGALAADFNPANAVQRTSTSEDDNRDPVAAAAQAALEAIGGPSFMARLDDAASVVAARLGADADLLHRAWVGVDHWHQFALLSALSQVGVAYHRNSSKPGVGFDCSGLTAYAWERAGVTLSRQSGRQIREVATRTHETAKAGDLAYYPGHVMIWLGVDNLIVHAADPARDVEVTDVSERRAGRLKFGDPTG
jgi:cell wall-associated NlpC family hydrolase